MLKINNIEKEIYGPGGLFERVVRFIDAEPMENVMKQTGKKRQYIDLFRRQFKNPDSFDYRPKFDTIKEMAEKLGVE